MRCVYCYNTHIVTSSGNIDKKEFLDFLKKRVGKLNGVVFSGGECTRSKEFLELAKEVKALGFKLKVDTNGTNFKVLKEAIELNLVDYIALDFKATKESYYLITKSKLYDEFMQTLKFLIDIDFPFEVRTTVHGDFLDENEINIMAKTLEKMGYKNIYYLQNFLYTGENFGSLEKPKQNFNPENLKTNLKVELRNF
ncbi:anaerobic ribonucleoside triphosphate reductase activating protein [Campylobacter blaseri]|nr:anaerobic ribonucleoside triphosphate reductase activating protein [Campylobacter blaseri]